MHDKKAVAAPVCACPHSANVLTKAAQKEFRQCKVASNIAACQRELHQQKLAAADLVNGSTLHGTIANKCAVVSHACGSILVHGPAELC